MIWEGAVYPHRIPLDFVTILPVAQRAEVGAALRNLLQEKLSRGYGMRILKQSLLPLEIGGAVLRLLREHSVSVTESSKGHRD